MKWIAIGLSFLLLASSQLLAQQRVFHFDSDRVDQPPDGFVIETAPGGKAIVLVQKMEDAPSKPNVLATKGSGFPGSNEHLCLAWFSHVENGKLSVNFKHRGEKDLARTGGFVWRLDSATGNMYSAEWDTLKSHITLNLIKDGKKRVLEKEKVKLPPNEWIMLEVRFQEENIEFLVDGKSLLRAKNDQIRGPGKVGLYVKSDAILLFDDFRIQSE